MDIKSIAKDLYTKHMTDDEGAFHPVVLGVITLGIVGIVFGIMVMIYAEIEPNIVGTSTASNASIAKISTNVYKGFNLGSIAPIVLAASLVITIVLGMVGAMYVGGRSE